MKPLITWKLFQIFSTEIKKSKNIAVDVLLKAYPMVPLSCRSNLADGTFKETHTHGPNVGMGSSPTLTLASWGKPLPAIQKNRKNKIEKRKLAILARLRRREGRNHGLNNYIDTKVKGRQFSIFLDATFCFGVYIIDESMRGAMGGEFLPFKYICTVTLYNFP